MGHETSFSRKSQFYSEKLTYYELFRFSPHNLERKHLIFSPNSLIMFLRWNKKKPCETKCSFLGKRENTIAQQTKDFCRKRKKYEMHTILHDGHHFFCEWKIIFKRDSIVLAGVFDVYYESEHNDTGDAAVLTLWIRIQLPLGLICEIIAHH